MKFFDRPDLFLQERNERLGQHCDAVFLPFAVPDNDAERLNVNIFDTQPYAFLNAQTGAIEQTCHEPRTAVHSADDSSRFVACEDDGEMLWPACTDNFSDATERFVENVLVQKK